MSQSPKSDMGVNSSWDSWEEPATILVALLMATSGTISCIQKRCCPNNPVESFAVRIMAVASQDTLIVPLYKSARMDVGRCTFICQNRGPEQVCGSEEVDTFVGSLRWIKVHSKKIFTHFTWHSDVACWVWSGQNLTFQSQQPSFFVFWMLTYKLLMFLHQYVWCW